MLTTVKLARLPLLSHLMACPRMSVGYAEVSSAYRTTLLGINPRMGRRGV